MAAEITINQPLGAGAGVAGKARQDIWLSKEVELVSSGDGSDFLWELLDRPLGSAATLTDEETALATFTPDKVGTYRIRLTIDELEYVVRVVRCRYDNLGVLTQRGWAFPAIDEQFGEANYDTNERHWAEVWETIMEDIRLNGLPNHIVYDLHKNLATDDTGVATVIGADYIDAAHWPTIRTVKFRCILETTSSAGGYEATADLFDTADVLGGGSPMPVAGSQVSTNALVAAMVEANVTAAFSGFSGAGVFEARLWIASTGGGNNVTCKSAQLIVEW
jgi:hypothetical protein